MIKEIDLENIQNYYNNEHTWEECSKKFNVSWKTLYKYKKEGKLIGRTLSESNKLKRKLKTYIVSKETREKISIGRKKYLRENKGKIKWPGKESNASLTFKKVLRDSKINFVEEFMPLENRYFRIDISFPDKKIGIEINGEQHYERNGSLRKYYQDRHDLIENEGWKLYEISHYLVYKKEFLENLIKELLNNNLENVDYSFYVKEKVDRNCLCGEKKAFNAKSCWECFKKEISVNKKSNISKDYIKKETFKKEKKENIFYCDCGSIKTRYSKICIKCLGKINREKNRKVIRPKYEQLLIDVENLGYSGTGRKYGVSDNSIRKWIKYYNKEKIEGKLYKPIPPDVKYRECRITVE